MKTLAGIILALLLTRGSFAQAAAQVCQGEDLQNGQSYHLQVGEMGLPQGALISVAAINSESLVRGLYEVSEHFETGMGTYVYLKFISGDTDRAYKLFISQGKSFLLSDNALVQLFCE